MMRDVEDRLWALADLVRPKRWKPFIGRRSNTFCVHDHKQREVIAWPGFDGSDTADTRETRARLCAFIAAADPTTIKKLIEENRRLRALSALTPQVGLDREELKSAIRGPLGKRAFGPAFESIVIEVTDAIIAMLGGGESMGLSSVSLPSSQGGSEQPLSSPLEGER